MKKSLKFKAVTGIILFSLITAAVAVTISGVTFARVINNHYKELSSSVVRATSSVLDAETVRRLSQMVNAEYEKCVEDYGGVPDTAEFSEEELAEYYARFSYLTETEEYKSLLGQLRQLKEDFGVKSLYIGYNNRATMEDLYIVDASREGDECVPGDFDAVEKQHIAKVEAGDFEFEPYITNYSDYGWISSASSPIYCDDGELGGVAFVDISMNEVVNSIKAFIIKISAIILLIAALTAVITVYLMNRTMILPINRLSDAARKFVSDRNGREGASSTELSKLDIRTGDEIENLSEAMKQMESDINQYIRNLTAVTAERERIGAELDVAKQIQTDMLPNVFPPFPERDEFDIYASMNPAKEVGGDFYDFFLADEDHLVLVIADVSGKGVPAALFMMMSKTLIKSAAQTGLSPKEILEKVNNQLCENNEAEMFVTVWLGIVEISTGKTVCANAGHEFPAIQRAGGEFELYRDKHGFVLAGMENMKYSEYEIQLSRGDRLFVYTDGVAEATNAGNELFGTERMINALNAAPDGSCEELIAQTRCAIDGFVKDAPQFDDITMLALRMNAVSTIELDATEASAARAAAFVEERMIENGIDMKTVYRMNIVVDEIYSNIIRYSGATYASIACHAADGRIKLVFTDNGKFYNPLDTKEPDVTLDADERTPGGLGIFIVKKTADKVDYEYKDKKNVLTVVKNCQVSIHKN